MPLHADGYISMFRLQNGRADYRGRFVRTERLVANRQLGRSRFGRYRNRSTDDEDVRNVDASAANTTPFAFAGRLFALKEDALPYEIDPVTLATLGRFDFGGGFRSLTFTAHPKVDGETGELIAYGYEATGPLSDDLFVYVIAPDGAVRREVRVKLPYLAMIHDIAITKNHILLPLVGFSTSAEFLAAGGPHWAWDRARPSHIGVMRRDGDGSDLRWFTGPLACMLHTFNAFEDGEGRIVMDAPFYKANPFPFFSNLDGSPWEPSGHTAHVRRLTFDLASASDGWTEEVLFPEVIGDLGVIDPRRIGHRHRYCFAGFDDPAQPRWDASTPRPPWPIANSYARFDLEARTVSRLYAGANRGLDECCFIPRSPDAREGEGWLIGVATDYSGGSELLVADAEKLDAGPLARVRLPFRVGPQVHGSWIAAGATPLPPIG